MGGTKRGHQWHDPATSLDVITFGHVIAAVIVWMHARAMPTV